jgi:SAM-dependent methyltransferase
VRGGDSAKAFWNARAREDAFHFVDNRLDYGNPDHDVFWSEGARDLQLLLDAVDLRFAGDEDVVEIGCGVGRLTRAMSPQVRSVRALDVSPEMLRLAREHNGALGNVAWIEGDGTSLSGIDDASADACVSHVVFQHIPDPAITLGYITEIGRVLRPGGWAAFQISDDPAVHRRRQGWRRRLNALRGRAPRGQDHPNWRGSAVPLRDVQATASAAGMSVERVVGEGTQYCLVRLRRDQSAARSATTSS